MKREWWHDKVAYQIYPKSFYDTNGDGIGDLRGVIQKLDYLKELGIDIIWLSPIYASPMKDNGYDISDYYSIDPRFGTMEDMEELLAEAKKRDMYVLMDLVINHCSDKHEWFQKALADPDGPYADYFYLKEGLNGTVPNNWRSYFGGSVWEPVPGTDKYYLHLFDKGQPDLNWENETVRRKLYDMVNWWLDKGLAGFRIDAIINIKKDLTFQNYPADGPDGLCSVTKMIEHAHGVGEFLNELKHETFDKHHAFTIGEVFNITDDELEAFIGENGYFSCQFDFDHTLLGENEKGWYAFEKPTVKEWRDTLLDTQKRMEPIGMLSNIIENHDRPRGASTFIPEEDWCMESVTALATVSVLLKGLPFLYQGQEIGMTNCPMKSISEYDDISTIDQYQVARDAGLSEEDALAAVYPQSRDNCRTMMQWDSSEYAGFSNATPWFAVNPNYKKINVAAQESDEHSILSYYKKLIRLRKSERYSEVFTYGKTVPIDTASDCVIAYQRVLSDSSASGSSATVLCNFSAETVTLQPHCEEVVMEHVILNNCDDFEVDDTNITLMPYQTVVLGT